ncbi:glutathione S-transferase Mu 1-like [Ambystoma mexicanum]|uniref:glutathione S-transferase Mu 1-like n=1 Tax=Ambystoma mexicanum TaxID=8296 RepID=UPI0037E7A8BA
MLANGISLRRLGMEKCEWKARPLNPSRATFLPGGGSEEEMCRVDLLVDPAMDVRLELGSVVYNPNLKTLKGPFVEKLPGKLRLFSRFLGERKWFAREQITFVDFLMYDILDQHRMLEPKTFMQDFEALEKISAFMKTSHFKKTSSNAMARLWNVA